ncbi:MAG: flagellar export protein FliJ, partial [Hyphomonadaceae bacterium]|nr:flagellar export protein FliJ [Clostridia bacterium]
LSQLQQTLASLEQRQEMAQTQLKQVVQGGITVNQLQEYYSYLKQFKDTIDKQMVLIEAAHIKCEKIRNKLIEVRRAIKMLETLKEQKYQAYVDEVALEDLKTIDDYINSRVIVQ